MCIKENISEYRKGRHFTHTAFVKYKSRAPEGGVENFWAFVRDFLNKGQGVLVFAWVAVRAIANALLFDTNASITTVCCSSFLFSYR
jgi:hypothetical protein